MTKKEIKLVDDLMSTPKKEWERMNSPSPHRGCAFILNKDGYSVCVSYETPIAMKTPKNEFVRLWNGYSKTSIGHLSAWCNRVCLPFVNGKKWDKMVIGRKYSKDKVEAL